MYNITYKHYVKIEILKKWDGILHHSSGTQLNSIAVKS